MSNGDERRAPSARRPIRWTVRLIGSTMVAAAVTAVVLVLARPADTQDCLKTTQTIEDLSRADAAAGGARGPEVVAATDHAATRMGRRLSTQNEQLHAVFADLKDAVARLQDAARTGPVGNASIDRVLRLIDTLDARGQVALTTTGSVSPPTG